MSLAKFVNIYLNEGTKVDELFKKVYDGEIIGFLRMDDKDYLISKIRFTGDLSRKGRIDVREIFASRTGFLAYVTEGSASKDVIRIKDALDKDNFIDKVNEGKPFDETKEFLELVKSYASEEKPKILEKVVYEYHSFEDKDNGEFEFKGVDYKTLDIYKKSDFIKRKVK